MGLKDYRQFKKMKDFEATLSRFGVSLEDIKSIPSLKTEIKELKERVNILETTKVYTRIAEDKPMSEEDKKAKAVLDGKTMPEDFIKLFSTDLEELKSNA